MWSVDRLHPGERGHWFLAGAYFDLLGAAGFPVRQRPGAEPTSPPPSVAEQTRWMLTKGLHWLCARSTDLVPYLARMVVAEWWHGLRGRADRLDYLIEDEARGVMEALSLPSGSRRYSH